MSLQAAIGIFEDIKINRKELLGLNATTIMANDKGEAFDTGSYQCHAGLLSKIDGGKHFVVTGLQNPKVAKGVVEDCKPYLQWLMCESIYSEVFHKDYKSIDHVLEHGYFVLDVYKRPRNIVLAACQGIRRLWEFSQIPYIFTTMAEEGVNSELAYLLAHCYKKSEEDVVISPLASAHSPFRPSVSKTFVHNCINKRWEAGDSVNNMFGRPSEEDFLCGFLKTIELKRGVVDSNKNPFKNSIVKEKKKYNLKLLAKRIAEEYQQKLFDEVSPKATLDKEAV